MTSRLQSGHRRVESGGHHHHHRHSSSSGSTHHDSGQSVDAGPESCGKKHARSKSGGVVNRERHDSNGSQLSNDHHVRPTTLFPLKNEMDVLQPEREPIRFDDVNLVGAPPEVQQLVTNIKQVAEQFLYHWKTFPIILPSPVSQCESIPVSQFSSEGSLGRLRTKYHLRDLFVAPSFDELDAVAVDAKGEPRRLTGKQLEYIREKGEFEVESLNFPGQHHRWKLSEFIQKGVEHTRASLLNDTALALRFIFITAKGRIFGHFFSVAEALKSLVTGFLRILDLLVGVPSLQAHNLDAKIREERSKYLVAELVCRVENEESLEHLCSYIKKQLRRAATEKFEVTRECCPVAVPYKFLTPAGIELDLRLWDRNLMKRALPVLMAILERETRGWFLHFRERLIAEMRAAKMDDQEIEQQVNAAVMREYLQRVYNSILSHPDILQLGDGVAQLLVEQAQSVVLMHRAFESVQQRLSKTRADVKAHLSAAHPVLARIEPWLRAQLRATDAKFAHENQWAAHEHAVSLCQAQKCCQTCYFLTRDLAFMREREPALLRELRNVKTPTRSFYWPTQIWMPTNWIVRRNFQGQSDVIPTILSKQVTTITTPRSDPSQPVFLVEKEVIRTTTTRWPMWRLFNYFQRTWCWTWNAVFFFGVVLPWCSPLGVRALFCLEPFMPDLELSQVNGTLFPRKSSTTSTLCSRLFKLWRHISKSRTHFETKPDTGFIGKGFTRHLNRIYNYFIKGLFGSVLIMFVFPVICVTVILTSLLIAVTAVAWMPLLTLAVQVTNGLVYDLDCPQANDNRFFVLFEALIYQIVLRGCLQPVMSLCVALFLCPVISLVVLAGGLARYLLRLCWDASFFHLVIKKRGRIPSSDSWIVKRIAGPGLASDYYFKITPEQALAAFEAKMELDELTAFQTMMENIITQPQRDFAQFVQGCFGHFSTQLAKNGSYKVLEKECQDLVVVLHEKLEKRRRDLQTGLSVIVKSKIKLETADLKIAIQQGALLLEKFYPSRIIPKMRCTDDQFWDNKSLAPGDWAGLAGLLYSELFSLDFLTPLDHVDTSFKLGPHPNADLSRYSDMVECAGARGGPDLIGNVYTPRGNIQVQSPYLEVSAFNPRSKQAATVKKSDKDSTGSTLNKARTIRMPWKKYTHFTPDKMVIPLPVPHPAHIAVTVYNRDSDDPIPLESDICQSILRAVEENHLDGLIGGGDSIESSSDTLDSPQIIPDDLKRNSSTDCTYQWTLNNWGPGQGRKRNNSGSVRVDLASPEDVTLDSDSTRVVFSTYGTTV